jgi:hypothetical protein
MALSMPTTVREGTFGEVETAVKVREGRQIEEKVDYIADRKHLVWVSLRSNHNFPVVARTRGALAIHTMVSAPVAARVASRQ